MFIEFCPKCGGMVLPQRVWDYEDDRIVLRCSSCGYEFFEADKSHYSVEKKVNTKETVMMRGDETTLFSTATKICPKCGHNRVYNESRQVRSSAEGPTFLFRCVNCGFVFREQR